MAGSTIASAMPLITRRSLFSVLAALSALGLARRGTAQVGSGGTGISPSVPIGKVDMVTGSVTLRRAGQVSAPLESGGNLEQGDQIDTADGAEAHVIFDDGGYLAVRANSSVKIDRYVVSGDVTDVAALTLVKGALRSVTGWIGKLDPERYRIHAGSATIGVRGTDHEVVLVRPQDGFTDAQPGVHNRVNEGTTLLRSAGSTLPVDQGSAAYATRGGPPTPHAAVPAFFNRLRTGQDERVENHARSIQQHIETGLRQRGKLNANERFEQYRERVQGRRGQRAQQRAAPAGRESTAQAPAQAGHEQRAAARQQRHRERTLRGEANRR